MAGSGGVALRSDAHGLDHYALWSLAIPLAVEDALPGAEVEFSRGNGDDHFVADREGAEVGRGVVFTGSGVVAIAVGVPGGDLVFEPVEDVLPQTGLVVVHEDRR